MYQKTFVCLCRQTISRIYTIFNTVHAMSDINNIYQFEDIWRIFTRVRVRTTFFVCLKLLPPGRRVKKKKTRFKFISHCLVVFHFLILRHPFYAQLLHLPNHFQNPLKLATLSHVSISLLNILYQLFHFDIFNERNCVFTNIHFPKAIKSRIGQLSTSKL